MSCGRQCNHGRERTYARPLVDCKPCPCGCPVDCKQRPDAAGARSVKNVQGAPAPETVSEYAERLARAADGLSCEHEDTSRGVVTVVACVESYVEYRQPIADGYAAVAADTRGVVDNLTSQTG